MEKARGNPKKIVIENLTKKGLRSYHRIIDAGIAMIRQRGYAETTIQDICAQVGIGVGTFYHYFRSKEDVLLAFIDEENRDLLDFYARLDKTSCGRALLAVADHYVDMYFYKGVDLVSHAYSMMIFSTIDLGGLSEFAFQKIVRDLFLQGQRSGEFRQDVSADTFCDLVLSGWFYFTSLWCNDPAAFDLRQKAASHLAEVVRMVGIIQEENKDARMA